MIEFLSALFLGGLISWLITHQYYRVSNRDQSAVFDKLSQELKETILGDERKHLSVEDLNVLLRSRTIDEKSTDPLPYKACPKCGSENIYKTKEIFADAEADGFGEVSYTPTEIDAMKCPDCDWEENASESRDN